MSHEDQKPRHRFVLTATVGADTLDDLLSELAQMRFAIMSGTKESIGGGCEAWTRWKLTEDSTWTHERYMRETEETHEQASRP